ncbi:hypothetical protein RRG08_066239 [Elysia crispata]|uniref:Uncharacterized protein n=1 Tax=Elysia crispata TaxID=231223 RepID=A0AAE1BD97_9GAST|nr:hypothetical protein RRG08_066239 [Elysia crispata]
MFGRPDNLIAEDSLVADGVSSDIEFSAIFHTACASSQPRKIDKSPRIDMSQSSVSKKLMLLAPSRASPKQDNLDVFKCCAGPKVILPHLVYETRQTHRGGESKPEPSETWPPKQDYHFDPLDPRCDPKHGICSDLHSEPPECGQAETRNRKATDYNTINNNVPEKTEVRDSKLMPAWAINENSAGLKLAKSATTTWTPRRATSSRFPQQSGLEFQGIRLLGFHEKLGSGYKACHIL